MAILLRLPAGAEDGSNLTEDGNDGTGTDSGNGRERLLKRVYGHFVASKGERERLLLRAFCPVFTLDSLQPSDLQNEIGWYRIPITRLRGLSL